MAGQKGTLTVALGGKAKSYPVTVFSAAANKYVIRADAEIRMPGRGRRLVLREGSYTAWPQSEIVIKLHGA